MSKTLQQKKATNELPLFRSTSMFLYDITQAYIRMQRDIKRTYGDFMMKENLDMLNYIRRSYTFYDINEKLDNINKAIDVLDNDELLLKVLFELKYIDNRTMANLSIKISDVLTQMKSFKASIENRLKKQEENSDNSNDEKKLK